MWLRFALPSSQQHRQHRCSINSNLSAKCRSTRSISTQRALYQQFKLFAVTIWTSIYSFSCFLHVGEISGISVQFHLCKQVSRSFGWGKQGINKTWQNKQSTIFRDQRGCWCCSVGLSLFRLKHFTLGGRAGFSKYFPHHLQNICKHSNYFHTPAAVERFQSKRIAINFTTHETQTIPLTFRQS